MSTACFTDPEFYRGEIPREHMRRLNEQASAIGWEAAIRELVDKKELLNYICSPSRADFRHLWKLPPEANILELGAGLGAITSALARDFARVTAVESVPERARFIQLRALQEGRPGVEVVCADYRTVPLASAQFDAVVLNGVLAWSALNTTGSPRAAQLRFLRRVQELLKPGGLACVGIENRIGYAALRGGNDHSGLPYTSLMPRFMADLACRLSSRAHRFGAKRGYRTYTYSLPGYRRLFREAGFNHIQAFHAWNGYNDPTVLLPLEGASPLIWFASRKLSRRYKQAAANMAARTGIWARLASEYIFVLRRQ